MSIPIDDRYIFVVDDTAFMRAALIKSLLELGYDRNKISQFENGWEALESLKKDVRCHLILCDWNMPHMTGGELLKTLRTPDSPFNKIPFVLITTDSEREKVVEAIQYRVNGYIIKPLQMNKLMESLSNVFGDDEESVDE